MDIHVLLKRICICLVSTALIVPATTVFAADPPLCKPQENLQPVCTHPNESTRYVLDLGHYRGVFAMDAQRAGRSARFSCPTNRRCVCDLLPNQVPDGDWILAFSGNYETTVRLRFDQDRLKMSPSFLGKKITQRGNSITLSSAALRTVWFEADNNPVWGIEYWDCVNEEMKAAWRQGKDYKAKLILKVVNNVDAGNGIQSLTAFDDPTGFSSVPSFLQPDTRHKRALKFKPIGP